MLLCNPRDNIPEVQGRVFNHTPDYAIAVKRPAEKEDCNLRPGPCSLLCLILPDQPFYIFMSPVY